MIRRIVPAAGVALAAALVLAGCTPPAAEPTAWQQNVQTVADQASSGDYISALASLDALEADVVARRDAGEIAAEEADGILSRIATVRADLSSLMPTPTPTPTPTETSEPVETTAPVQQETRGTDDGGSQKDDPGDKDDKGPGGKDDKTPGDKGPGKKDG